MKKTVLLVLCGFLGLATFSQTIIYVTPDGAGNKSGSSWGNAAPGSQLQSKIDGAASNDQVWIAAGTYAPNASPASCANCGANKTNYAFMLKAGVSLFGGFAGTETSLSQRNINANITKLSGDLSSAGYSGIHTNHVVLALNGNETLDGLTISDGYANFSDEKKIAINGIAINNSCGGGVYAYNSNLVLNNVTITNNTVYATSNVAANMVGNVLQTTGDAPPHPKGGGVYNEHGNLSLFNVVFSNNTARGADGVESGVSYAYGGGLYHVDGSLLLSNVKFSNNTAQGGSCFGYHPILTNTACTDVISLFSRGGSAYGGGLYSLGGGVLTNVTFEGNAAKGGGAYGMAGIGSGGGMETNGTTSLNQVYFTTNTATGGNANIVDGLSDWGGDATGGGLTNNGNITGLHVYFTGNTVTGGGGSVGATGSGGGMYNNGGCRLSFASFGGNAAYGGSAIGKENGPYNGNAAVYCGTGGTAGAAAGGGLATPGQADVSNSIFYNNGVRGGTGRFTQVSAIQSTVNGGAGAGGGISAGNGSTFTNVALYNNGAAGGVGLGGFYSNAGGANGQSQGGGFMGSGSVLTNLSFSGNKANNGGGMAGSSKVRNSIFWGNTFNDNDNKTFPNNPVYYQVGAPLADIRYSIVQGGLNPSTDAAYHILDANPLFISGTNLALNTGSPAINAGNNTYFSADTIPNISNITNDAAAKPRMAGTSVDMGAYENQSDYVPPPLAITTVSKDTVCSGTTMIVTFSITGIFKTGNIFAVQLSDANGFFNNATTIGTGSSIKAGKITCTIPADLNEGDYHIRITATKPASTSAVYDTVIHVNSAGAPSLSITTSSTIICTGTQVNISALTGNVGLNPVYQWMRNGQPVAGNSANYIVSDLVDGDSIYCIVTSSAACGGTPVTSNTLHFTVNGLPQVPAISGNSNYCMLNDQPLILTDALQGGRWNAQPAASITNTDDNKGIAVFNLTQNTHFTYTYTDENGCVGSVYKDVTVGAVMPDVSAIAGTAPSCGGTTFQLTDATPGGIWSTDAPTIATVSPTGFVTALNGGTVNVSYTVTQEGGGCQAVANKTITLKQQPYIGTVTGGNSLYVGRTLQLSNDAPGGTWKITNTGLAGISATGLVNGKAAGTDTATYRISGTNGCNATALQQLTIKSAPVIPAITGNASICTGVPVQYNNTLAGGIWGISNSTVAKINADGVVTGLKAGVDTVFYTVTNEDGYTTAVWLKITVGTSLTPTVTIAASAASPICAATKVNFTATVANGSNTIYQWYKNNTPVGTNSKSYVDSLLNNGDSVWCLVTVTANCLTTNTAKSNVKTYAVNPRLAPTLAVTANTGTTICQGTTVTFTAKATNTGASPRYQWKRNGVNVGGNSTTYTVSNLTTNDTVYCILTIKAPCATPASITSTKLRFTVNPILAPSVSIASTPASPVCAGTKVTFTATAVNAASPTYHWYKNGIAAGANNKVYADAALEDGDSVWCIVTSAASCLTTNTVKSNVVKYAVNPKLSPALVVTANTGSTICAGTQVTFTAAATNTGAGAVYQWKKNNVKVGGNSATYITSNLKTGDSVLCVLTVTAPCATPASITSKQIKFTVNPLLTPSVSISTSAPSPVCAGTKVNFTATAVNAVSPAYKWYKNNKAVGGNNKAYADTALANGDSVWCVITSTANCLTANTAKSNVMAYTVNPKLLPTLIVTANTATTICTGTPVTFTAVATGTGANPAYQWKKNNKNVGTNSTTYTDNGLKTGDSVLCVLTVTAPCATPSSITSRQIKFTVNPLLTPTVSITANVASPVCTGVKVTFTATAANAGSPVYQWYKNKKAVGTNSKTYADTALANKDSVWCIVTSTASCFTVNTAKSNVMVYVVNPNLSPKIAITANTAASICARTAVTFTATSSSTGSGAKYQWKKNSVNVGKNSKTYVDSTLNNNDTVYCVLTITAPCAAATSLTSNKIKFTVTAGLPDAPSDIKGNSPVAANQANLSYSVTRVAGVVYNWVVPAGVTIVSGQGTYKIVVNWGSTAGTISVTANNTCGASVAVKKAVALTTGLMAYNPKDPATWPAYVKLYPNPATSIVTVEFNAADEDKYEAQLVTSLGQVLQSKASVSVKGINTVSFDVTKYASAMYYVRLVDKEHGVRTVKLVKAK